MSRNLTRRKIREEIFKLLFSVEFHTDAEWEEQMDLYEEGRSEPLTEEDRAYVETKYRDILAHLPQIDAILSEKVTGWKLERMAKVDLTLLRLATYEIRFEEDMPQGVAINEAVELAKRFGTEKSGSFVNGALSKVIA